MKILVRLTVFFIISMVLPLGSLSKDKDIYSMKLEEFLTKNLDVDLLNWIPAKYPKLIFEVTDSGEIISLREKSARRDYNTRVCKSYLSGIGVLNQEFRSKNFEIECRPQFELTKQQHKKNLQYQKKYAKEIGILIFNKAHKESFRELEANLLSIQLQVNSAGEVVGSKLTSSSGNNQINQAFLTTLTEIGELPKPDMDKYRIKVNSMPSTATVNLDFHVGRNYKNVSLEDSVAIGSALGRLGIATASFIQSILLLAR